MLILVLSIPLAWLAAERNQKNKERAAAAAIEELGGSVSWNWTDASKDAGVTADALRPPGSPWLRFLLGDDFFVHVTEIDLSRNTRLTDADLSHLGELPRLMRIYVHGTAVSDDGLRHLKRLAGLELLYLLETQATLSGTAELQRALPQCEIILYEQTDNDGVGYENVPINNHYRNFAPIHEAAKQGDVEMIRQELAKGVPVDLRVANRGGTGAWEDTTPLMWAALRGQVAAVQFLTDAGADIDAKSDGGVTALMAAAGTIETTRGDPTGCLIALLKAGANREAADQEGHTAVYYACGAGRLFDDPPDVLLPPKHRLPDPFRLIRPYVAGSIGSPGYPIPARLLHSRHGDARRLQLLLRAGVRINVAAKGGETPLRAACYSADPERLRLLLGAGADAKNVAGSRASPLRAAAHGGNAEMMRMLLEAGSPIDGVLHAAAMSEEDAGQKVRLLVERGANVNEISPNGETPLISSLWWSKCDAAPALLEAGANPRVRDKNGENTLILAARNGPAAALKRLLELRFDPDECSRQEGHPTALILAAASERDAAEKVRLLLGAGARIDRRDDRGSTALLAASRAGRMDAVVALADAGADVNVSDAKGMTPLHFVANRGEDWTFMCEQTGGEAARALLRHGAKVDARDSDGQTPRLLAEGSEHKEALEVLNESHPPQ